MIYNPADETTFPKTEAERIRIRNGLAGEINLTDVIPPENCASSCKTVEALKTAKKP